jgi:hypothetical protein
MASSGILRRDIPEDAILHSHRRENLKSYTDKIFHHITLVWENTSDTLLILYCYYLIHYFGCELFYLFCKYLNYTPTAFWVQSCTEIRRESTRK